MNGSSPDNLPDYLGPAPLAPAFTEAFAQGDEAGWASLVTEVGPRVWAFPFLTPAACANPLAEIDRRAVGRGGGAA